MARGRRAPKRGNVGRAPTRAMARGGRPAPVGRAMARGGKARPTPSGGGRQMAYGGTTAMDPTLDRARRQGKKKKRGRGRGGLRAQGGRAMARGGRPTRRMPHGGVATRHGSVGKLTSASGLPIVQPCPLGKMLGAHGCVDIP